MKKIAVLLLVTIMAYSCKNEKKEGVDMDSKESEVFASFGEKIEADNALSVLAMAEKYQVLKVGDTLETKVSANINEVCSSKGCWMKLDLGDDKEIMVRFKDYGFFMPLNAEGNVIVNGKAYITETSVDELRHYAEDAGKSKKEIEAITEPERTYAFEADGVLLKQ
jgi:hypothetical protein